MKNLTHCFWLLFGNLALAQTNLPPVLSNAQVQLLSNNQLSISYDLVDAEGDPITITLRAGQYGSTALGYDTNNATGDVGPSVSAGTGKNIVWDYSAYAAQAPNDFRIMLVADDNQPVDIQALVNEVDSNQLYSDLSFVQGIRHRNTGAAHLQATKDFIFAAFEEQGLEAYQQPWAYGSYDAHNVIGRKPGTSTDGGTYILGGHFDTVADAPGADDNGTAVVGMLEAMRVLSKFPTKNTLKFIGFDLEEAGLLGSIRYVQNGIPNGELVKGMIDFEMIGYYSEIPNTQEFPPGFQIIFPDVYADVEAQQFKGNFITNVGRQGSSATLMNSYKNASATYVPELRVVNVQAPANWQAITPDLGRSDHAPFWLSNIPAIMLTDGAEYRNHNYHTPNDVLDSLNFTFMTQVVKGTVATLAELAEVQHADMWWTDTDFFTQVRENFACDLQITPNPAHDILTVSWGTCNGHLLEVQIIDAAGRIARQARPSTNSIQFDVEDLQAGTYFVKMVSKNGTSTSPVILD